jgi:hypothetical protein
VVFFFFYNELFIQNKFSNHGNKVQRSNESYIPQILNHDFFIFFSRIVVNPYPSILPYQYDFVWFKIIVLL